MTSIELWWLSLAIFAVVVTVVALLLGLILAAAKNVDRNAAGIWTVGKEIAGNTVSIWMLERNNDLLRQIGGHARRIEEAAVGMEEKLGLLAKASRKGR
jgi:hypothetical protein